MNKEARWLLEEKHGGIETEAFFKDLARLQSGEPLAYVIGHSPFLSTKIYLDSRPLIPRPETEFWVEAAIQDIRKKDGENLRVLDLCAGSGCIGVAILHALKHARVDFVEIDPAHHPTILKNIRESGSDTHRARIFGGSLFEKITDRYDVILANPPYIDPLNDRTEKSVTAYEPHPALYGGAGGLEIIFTIIREATLFLNPEALLYLEHDPWQVQKIAHCAGEFGFTIEHHKDQYGILRYSQLRYTKE